LSDSLKERSSESDAGFGNKRERLSAIQAALEEYSQFARPQDEEEKE
jgi:hypothetical protein